MVGAPQALKNLRIFEGICGRDAFKNVVLTTTMWDDVDKETGATREAELKSIYWKSMIDRGSSTGRFKGTRDSAFHLIAPLRETNNRIPLSIQKDLVDRDFKLSETVAGQVLRLEIKRSAMRQQEAMHQVQKKLKQPNDSDATSLQPLMEEFEELKRSSGSLFQQMDDLRVPLGRQATNVITRAFGIKHNRFVYKNSIIGSY